MSSFSYENKNEKLYLVYKSDVTEVIDGYTLGIVINNPMVGLAQVMFSNDINGKMFTYDVTGTMKLKDLLAKGINEKIYFSMLISIANTLNECEKQGLNVGSLILNEELIFCNEEKGEVYFICIPTSGFIVTIDSKEILRQFSTVLMNRMEVTNSSILEINEYLSLYDLNYSYADFVYKLNQYIIEHNIEVPGAVIERTRQTAYQEEPAKTRQPNEKNIGACNMNEMSSIIDSAEAPQVINASEVPQVINNSEVPQIANNVGAVQGESKATAILAGVGSAVNKTIDVVKNKGTQAINATVRFKDKAVSNIKVKINNLKTKNNSVQNYNANMGPETNGNIGMKNIEQEYSVNENLAYGDIGNQSSTMILDCVTGETQSNNAICTAEPYLIRVSTGEKINITQTNFKLGRSKSRADYYVGDNDTISKVHAFIVNSASQYYIVDNGSSNRTYLDGNVLEPIIQNRLRHQSKIRLAKEEFIFYLY